MPREGLQWWHVIISTLNSWLPGDPRGFRSRGHKIHSSGDYKNPPPQGEHAGLHRYYKARAPVVIPAACRETVGRAILAKLQKLGYRVLAVAVAPTHSHLLAELPADEKEVRLLIGQCKTTSSHAIRDQAPGRVWAYRGKNLAVKDRAHQLNVYQYILKQKDAWIWDFKQAQG
jgi:REP element-mobilizing transposase RayT